jgi:branched-chain amino acid aminotransferase
MSEKPERVAYFNGAIVPESQVLVPLRDGGFLYGYAAFDTERTFAHELYRLEEHLERFYRSLAYLGLDPGMEMVEMAEITRDVVARNVPLIDADDDYWVTQRVTLGQKAADGWQPSVIVECNGLPFAERARGFRDGLDVVVPSIRRTPPESMSPRAKTHNYINLILADREVKAHSPEAWSVLLDTHGNLCEGVGSNLFVVRDGELYTPREQMVLPGVSRSVVLELAAACGIRAHETDIDLFDAQTAEEAFLTSTSLCLCPVRTIAGKTIGSGEIPGPVTRALIDAWVEELGGFDFVGQYLRRLEAATPVS